MNSPHETATSDVPDHDLIDRLVEGSLPENERRALMIRLEQEPDGWRRCALAFLESQLWREAFAPLSAAASGPLALVSSSVARKSMIARRIARWSMIAAGLVAAFTLGWTLKYAEPSANSQKLANESPAMLVVPAESLTADVEVSPINSPSVAETAREASVAMDEKQTLPAPAASTRYVDAVVKSFQKNGFSAERQNAYVTMTFPDGKPRRIPSEEIRVRFTGGRTF